MTRFFHGAATSIGRVRRVNEDSYLAAPPIFAVADGMGGHDAGEVASAVAIDVMARYARGGPLLVDAVLAALDEANRQSSGATRRAAWARPSRAWRHWSRRPATT